MRKDVKDPHYDASRGISRWIAAGTEQSLDELTQHAARLTSSNMIKFVVVLSAVVAVALADDKYSAKFDNINVDEILSNPRLYSKYLSCLLNEPDAKCTPDGKFLKETIPDALTSDCNKCTEKQKQNADKIINYMIEHKPDDYKKIEELYDKEGVFRKKFSH